MAVSKKFYEAASKDEALRAELERATYGALEAFLRECGLEEEAAKATEAAVEKVAEAYGFVAEGPEVLDLDELDAVAGGACGCPGVGGGTGDGKKCACVGWGQGEADLVANDGTRSICVCVLGGGGGDN